MVSAADPLRSLISVFYTGLKPIYLDNIKTDFLEVGRGRKGVGRGRKG
jgi:hypothetical protein